MAYKRYLEQGYYAYGQQKKLIAKVFKIFNDGNLDILKKKSPFVYMKVTSCMNATRNTLGFYTTTIDKSAPIIATNLCEEILIDQPESCSPEKLYNDAVSLRSKILSLEFDIRHYLEGLVLLKSNTQQNEINSVINEIEKMLSFKEISDFKKI